MKYRDPICYMADLEVMLDKSYSTARRVMARIRKYYGLKGREKPTIQQVESYLVKI